MHNKGGANFSLTDKLTQGISFHHSACYGRNIGYAGDIFVTCLVTFNNISQQLRLELAHSSYCSLLKSTYNST